jgi:hypothetical protein
MPPKPASVKVKVTKWPSKAKSRKCLRLIIDDDEIDEALATAPWTSPKVSKKTAAEFCKSLADCGGAAEIV